MGDLIEQGLQPIRSAPVCRVSALREILRHFSLFRECLLVTDAGLRGRQFVKAADAASIQASTPAPQLY